jgi:adenylate cyclase
MYLSRKFKIRLQRLTWIVFFWTLIGALDAMGAYALSVGDLAHKRGPANFIGFNVASAFLSSIVSGILLVFYLRDRFQMKSFGFALLISSLVLSVLNFAIFLLTHSLLLSFEYGKEALDPALLARNTALFERPYYIRILVFWSIIAFLTIITMHVNEKYGSGVLLKMILGHYHRPREEERVFMFADIKSSTEIAEKLGHIRFFNLLNDFFNDVTGAIVETRGEIYQYVGDEIVISWTMRNGLRNQNCIRCYNLMQEAILTRSSRYLDKYGLVPEFKAGLHCGLITTGEIGVIKKDIVFSGDVLNTTARIQAVCNKFRVRILMSRYLLDKLNLPPNNFDLKRVGIIELKGKKNKVELYTFQNAMYEDSYENMDIT